MSVGKNKSKISVLKIVPVFSNIFVAHVGINKNAEIACLLYKNEEKSLNDILLEKSLCGKFTEKLRPIVTANDTTVVNKALKMAKFDETEKVTISNFTIQNEEIEVTVTLEKYLKTMPELTELAKRLWKSEDADFVEGDLILFKYKNHVLRGRIKCAQEWQVQARVINFEHFSQKSKVEK